LKPGGTVVEGTAGNTGIGLAHVCRYILYSLTKIGLYPAYMSTVSSTLQPDNAAAVVIYSWQRSELAVLYWILVTRKLEVCSFSTLY
jgi:hypothetical protein